MKNLLFAITVAAAASITPAFATDVGLSISIGQPGYYGQVDIGDVGRPAVIYARPVVIQRPRRGVVVEPLYLRVPRNHASNWRRYCGRYNACGRPVYFVRDDWYNNVYAPRYREEHRGDHRDDRRDDRWDGHDNRGDRHDGDGRNDRDDRRDNH